MSQPTSRTPAQARASQARASQKAIPCVIMRGGTSRGPYLLASDLPADPARRDEVLMALMGSGQQAA